MEFLGGLREPVIEEFYNVCLIKFIVIYVTDSPSRKQMADFSWVTWEDLLKGLFT